MRTTPFGVLWALGLALLTLAAGGCAFGGANQRAAIADEPAAAERDLAPAERRLRPPINTTRNLYEGSLWRGAASWGNLLRDHRARYRGDLLTASELQKIVKVPEPPPAQEAPAPPEEDRPREAIDPVLEFLRLQEERREAIEREQNEILRALDTIEVEVVRVLPNGNMFVRGVHPPIFRDSNRVKYLVTLQGIVRPSDVDENNAVLATRISKAELNVRRFVRREDVPISDAARAIGEPGAGALVDRLTDFFTGPGTGGRSTPVPTR